MFTNWESRLGANVERYVGSVWIEKVQIWLSTMHHTFQEIVIGQVRELRQLLRREVIANDTQCASLSDGTQ